VQAVVSPERLEEKFRRLGEFLAVLRELRSVPAEALPGDLVRMGSVKYYLQVSIESCIDVAQHVIASEGFRPPKDYADTFTVLAERGILEQEFAERLRRMAKFRNRLVHLYGEVDDRHVVRVLAEDLGDFDLFRERILAMLK
jgi:uncharacterized protein YutE (UPF0331/DUF86 family)